MTLTPDAEAGLWVSVSDLALRNGVTKQSAAERVKRLEAAGTLTTRPGHNRAKLVNLAQYDKAVGLTGDAVRQAAAARRGPASDDPILAKEQARKLAYQADLAKLDLDERLGKLLPVSQIEAAMLRCGEAMVRALEQMPSRADDIASGVASDGVNGARQALKRIAREMRGILAREMRLLESDAPASAAETEAE